MGWSTRYQGENETGYAAWVADAATGNTLRIGFFNSPGFTRSTDGHEDSQPVGLAENGRVSGHSKLFNGAVSKGYAAWVADAKTGTTKRVGFFTGNEFVRSGDSFQHSMCNGEMTESGYLTGHSLGFKGAADSGRARRFPQTSLPEQRQPLKPAPENYCARAVHFSEKTSFAPGVNFRVRIPPAG